jgi:lysophospholipase L1-like esterase
MATSEETVHSISEVGSVVDPGLQLIRRKPGRTILLTALFAMLPLIIPGIGHLLGVQEAGYREMLPSWRELISFRGSTMKASSLPGASTQDEIAQTDLVEPTPDAANIVDSTHALDAFYASLARTEARQPGAITRITHYGDSPITNDGLTAPVRRLLQVRFGDAGHGFILLDRPWAWYGHQNISFTPGGGWSNDSIMNPRVKDGAFGLGGVDFRANGAGKYVKFGPGTDGDTGKNFSRMDVYYLRQPNGGQFEASINGSTAQTVSTASETAESGFFTVEAPQKGENSFEIKTTNGSVRMFGAVIENDGPGVVYDSLGVNGAFAGLLATVMNEQHWTAQLQHRNPNLIILNYGTNESQYASDDQMARYERDLREVVRRVHAALPNAGVLIVSPMDRGTHQAGKIITLPSIPRIVEMQRRVAAETDCGFFDLFNAMGGEGTMAKWHEGKDHLVGGDLTHPNGAGADKIGGLIYHALIDGYDRYLVRHPLPKVQTPVQKN